MENQYQYKYDIVTKSVHLTATNTIELAKLLGISMSSIKILVNEVDDSDNHFLSKYIKITRTELSSKRYKYDIVTKPIHLTTNNITDVSKLLCISMTSIQYLLNNSKKHLLSQFITLSRTRLESKIDVQLV